MASHEREGLLPVQLFRDGDVSFEDFNNNCHHQQQQQQQQQQQSHSFMVSPKGLRKYESFSAVSYGSSYTSWSDLSSPFGSELETTSTSETTESEDEEFISELTRQMAESMLQDDDDEEEEEDIQFRVQDRDDSNIVDSVSSCFPDNNSQASESSVNWSDCKSSSVCYYSCSEFPTPSESAVNAEESSTSVEVYELKNQPQLNNKQDGCVGGGGVGVGGYGGKRVDMAATESTHQQPVQQRQTQKEQQNRVGCDGVGGRAWKQQGKKNNNIPPVLPTPSNGSGMRAVFIGRSYQNGYTTPGTGVFLPTAAAYTKPEPKRKSGCSTVLVPARVLQTLQQHFNTVGTTSPSNAPGGGSAANLPWRNAVLARINGLLSQKREHAEFNTRPPQPPAYSAPETNYHPEVIQLPQEWTY